MARFLGRRFRIMSLFVLVVAVSLLGIGMVSTKVSSNMVVLNSDFNSIPSLPPASVRIGTAVNYNQPISHIQPPSVSSTIINYVSNDKPYKRLNTNEADINSDIAEGRVLFLNSLDAMQTMNTKSMIDWEWNALLAPTLSSPGVNYDECLEKIKSHIKEIRPQAVVFVLSALMADDVPFFSRYMANQLKYFFELLHFLDSFEATQLTLVAPYSFETGIKLSWFRLFSLTLVSSGIGNLGHARVLRMKKLDPSSSDNSRCSNIQLVFRKFLMYHGNLQEEVMFCPGRKQSGGKNVIISTYFTSGSYSQYGHPFKSNDFKFMKKWFLSGSRMSSEATLVIFHDNIQEQFQTEVKKIYQKVEFIKTMKFGPGRTPNDGRFFVWYDYLLANPDIDNVLATDIRDVHFLTDPFPVMDTIGNYLYLGVDNSFHMNAFSNNGVRSNTLKCHASDKNVDFYLKLRPFYNAGVVGGKRKTVMNFLQKIMDYLNHTPKNKNCNMGTYALVAGKFFFDSSFTGYPFQSAFKIGVPGPTNVAVKHKVFPGNNVYDDSMD